ncbi:MAG: hypothetical protein R3C13_03885 [Hyphomonas sp.]|uniref:hypothetical protein n=1 Tax=Hyphomonas sp. TaxID=87 RepID=UPI0035277327
MQSMTNLPPDPLSPGQIQLALRLRLLSLFAFPAAAALAAVLERSFLVLLLLAAGMMLVSWIERTRFLRAAGETRLPDPGAFWPGFAVRTGLLLGIFVVTLGLLALFRDTALARGFGWIDLLLAGGTTAIVYGMNAWSARLAATEANFIVTQLKAPFAPGHAPGSGAGPSQGPANRPDDIIEGEFRDLD